MFLPQKQKPNTQKNKEHKEILELLNMSITLTVVISGMFVYVYTHLSIHIKYVQFFVFVYVYTYLSIHIKYVQFFVYQFTWIKLF